MKTLAAGFQAHLDAGTTTLAWCWLITRADGAVFGFTDHDRALLFDGIAFEPDSGLSPSELRAGSDLSVDAQDAEGALRSDMITETDIVDGRWDNAAVETWRVNWRDTTQRALMAKGSLGQIRRGKKAFVAEVRGMAHLLNQPVGRTYQSLCDALVGDVRCGVDLNDPAYQGTGAVTALASGRRFTVSGLDGFDGDWFAAGLLTWSTGQNAGRTVEVSEHDLRAGTVHVTLGTDPVRRVEIGDQFTITAGCDQRRATCAVKFANVQQFRGFDDIPGSDAVFRVARKAGANTGETL